MDGWRPGRINVGVGSAITFTGTLLGHPYRDRGTILAFEPERMLRYNHWSSFSRRADSDEARTVVTLTLRVDGDETCLEVNHDNLTTHETFGHARFFWRGALTDVKDIAENR